MNAKYIAIFLLVGQVTALGANADGPSFDCEREMLANSEFSILKGKLDLLNSPIQPTEILANNRKPTEREKKAIARWVEEQKRCSAPGIALNKSKLYEAGVLIERAYADLYLSAADLYARKITYGDFAKASVRRHQELWEQVAVVAQSARAERELQAKREDDQRREREAAEKQALDAKNYERQARCEALRQEILAEAAGGASPYDLQQQQQAQLGANASAYARMTPTQRGAYGLYQGGQQIAGALLPPSLGVQAAQLRQALMLQKVQIYKTNCQN